MATLIPSSVVDVGETVVKDSLPTIWPLEPHTRAKHALLQGYLGAWFPIMSRYNGRIVMLDGFAGPNRYAGGESGSPSLTLETLTKHRYDLAKNRCEFLILFNEADPERYASLEAEIRAIEATTGWPEHVKVGLYNEDFEHLAADLLDALKGARLAPTFAFLDPFGYQSVPMALMKELLNFPKCELFIYFDANSVIRFATAGLPVEEHFIRLFGTDEFLTDAPPGGDGGRKEYFRDLYARQLRDVCGFPYVRWFEMRDNRNRTIKYMFFCTRSVRGLSRMKDAMWSVDPTGDFAFSDYLNQRPVLFSPGADTAQLRDALVEHFGGAKTTIEQVIEFTVVETPYSESHVKKQTLKPMQEAGLIEVPGQRRKGTFPEGTEIVFS